MVGSYDAWGGNMTAKRILLVEDNPDDQVLALRALKRTPVDSEVNVVSDGVEALEFLLAEDRELPCLVLLDLKLPRMDGHEFLKQVRAETRTRHLPVVVMTSSNEERDILKSYELGANSYIHKPVDFNQFISTVSLLGDYWLQVNQNPYA